MTHVLSARERKALFKLSFDHGRFVIKGEMPGIGSTTLRSLVDLGLAEFGPSQRHYGQMGWRVTPDGWRCMYGETHEEIMAKPDGTKVHPFRIWRWPMVPNAPRDRMR